MNITNNLKDDILHAPDWFHQAIQDKPEAKYLNISWVTYRTQNGQLALIIKISLFSCMVVELTKNGGTLLGLK